jgi:hypothetical protein
MEVSMRKIVLTASALAALAAAPTAASAQVYYSTDAYVYGQPGAVVVNPPVVGAPMVESQVYLAPGATTIAPNTPYADQPIIINGERYYRDCWWDWGQRRCELKRWW